MDQFYKEEIQSLNTWNLIKHLMSHEQALPNAVEATKEGGIAWNSLMTSVEEERLNRNEVTEDPVIVQNTWTVAHDWGDEECFPSPDPDKNKKVHMRVRSSLLNSDMSRDLAG
ncbi:hypothetical protein POM88_012021 [Heracleum sosnowskyi]|uniref:Uncharacterized protein n=1 Tax=Heracleum sosnowskyi TaxID=360622 RepID=A0AAD8IZI3_9APIA|nr:hypothetical protein POM88_012021 [Heracleum sosnowskyi]